MEIYMLFYEFLKYLRVSKEMGLREFAHKIGMDVGNYSKLERGILNPPQKEELLEKISNILELTKNEKMKLTDLASMANGRIPEDITDDIKEYEYLPILLRTIANKKLTDEQLKEITERINSKY